MKLQREAIADIRRHVEFEIANWFSTAKRELVRLKRIVSRSHRELVRKGRFLVARDAFQRTSETPKNHSPTRGSLGGSRKSQLEGGLKDEGFQNWGLSNDMREPYDK